MGILQKLETMGVDTKAIIRKGTTVKEIKETLEKKYGKVKIHTTNESYYMCFIIDQGDNNRMLSAFFNDYGKSDYGIDGVLLSLGASGKAEEIMNVLLDEFGGYIDKNDCDDIGYEPVNLEAFNKSKEFTEMDKFRNEIIQRLGYDNLEITIFLFDKYKKL